MISKKSSLVHNEILNSVVICVNSIKSNAKSERLFKKFCERNDANHVRLILNTNIRWLSKGNYLKRFLELFQKLGLFLADKPEILYLQTPDNKAFLYYLTDVFEKLNTLNKQLQGKNKLLLDVKAKIFGFISQLELWRSQFSNRNFEHFNYLQTCEPSDTALEVILDYQKTLVLNSQERFSDLRKLDYPVWVTQPLLNNLSMVSTEFQKEFSELNNDESFKSLFNIKEINAWIYEEIQIKYPRMSEFNKKLLLPFPSSYLIQCGFSAVNDLLLKKRNSLNIAKRGNLRLKLTNFLPDKKYLCHKHQAQGSHSSKNK